MDLAIAVYFLQHEHVSTDPHVVQQREEKQVQKQGLPVHLCCSRHTCLEFVPSVRLGA